MTLADLLQTVRRVEVRTNRFANDMMVGAYLSRFKGRGMDFEELREYIPGDDVRDIDWNTTYRHGRVFVKRFREERELPMILALDVSGSNDFGSVRRSKREFATEIAATLAFAAARNGDKVGLLLFTDRVELYLPPRKGPPPHPPAHPRDHPVPPHASRHEHPRRAGLPESNPAPPLDPVSADGFPPQPRCRRAAGRHRSRSGAGNRAYRRPA
jgi:hypothetical protein